VNLLGQVSDLSCNGSFGRANPRHRAAG